MTSSRFPNISPFPPNVWVGTYESQVDVNTSDLNAETLMDSVDSFGLNT